MYWLNKLQIKCILLIIISYQIYYIVGICIGILLSFECLIKDILLIYIDFIKISLIYNLRCI